MGMFVKNNSTRVIPPENFVSDPFELINRLFEKTNNSVKIKFQEVKRIAFSSCHDFSPLCMLLNNDSVSAKRLKLIEPA